jgi:hypothetical protein
MMTNEAVLDRTLRVLLGVVLLSLVFFGPRTAWGWIGIVPLATGVVGYCPLYRLFGIDTCRLARRGA